MTPIRTLTVVTDYNPILLEKLLASQPNYNKRVALKLVESNYHNTSLLIASGFDSIPSANILILDLCIDTLISKDCVSTDFQNISVQVIEASVKEFLSKLRNLCNLYEYVLFNHVSPSVLGERRMASLTYSNPSSQLICMHFMSALVKAAQDVHNLVILHKQHLQVDYKSYFRLDCPYSYSEMLEFSSCIIDSVNLLYGQPTKVLCLDLDNTLWGGVVGEVGKYQIELGGILPIGKAFQCSQRILRRLKDQGFLLAVTSKNTESIAIDTIETHPEMILRTEDFSSIQITWNSKAYSIAQISDELELSVSSFVFIDDNIREIQEVEAHHSDIGTLDFRGDSIELVRLLNRDVRFQRLTVTREDLARSEDYKRRSARRSEILRIDASGVSISPAKLLQVSVSQDDFDTNFDRCLQLLNKTNQFNATATRYSSKSLLAKVGSKNYHFFAFRASDKFGPYGLISVISVANEGPLWVIDDFVLSCRAIDRGIAEAILAQAVKRIRGESFAVRYNETSHNQPILQFYRRFSLLNSLNQPVEVAKRQLLDQLEERAAIFE